MKKHFLPLITLIIAQFCANELFSQKYAFVSEIKIQGNDRTEYQTIVRELPFKRGDIIEINKLDPLLKEGRDNISNLSLFNFVYVNYLADAAELDNKYINIEIIVRVDERWYYWPKLNLSLDVHNINSWIKDPDWSKFTAEAGVGFNNMFGRNQTLKALLTMGYRRGFILGYSNIALDNEGRHTFDLSLMQEYSRHLNVGISSNSPFILRSDSLFLIKRYLSSLTYQFRPRPRVRNRIIFSYETASIEREVIENNQSYWGGDELYKDIISLKYNFIYDQRDNKQYPLEGYLISYQLNGSSDSEFEIMYCQLKTDIQLFDKIAKRVYFSGRIQAGASAKNKMAYIFDRAIGYGDVSMRGFEYYVADGQHYITLSPSLIYNLMPPAGFIIKPLRSLPKFSRIHAAVYTKCYFDIGYALHKYASVQNEMSNRLLMSWGLGIDLVAYYDITLSLDYSFNNFGKHGLFLAFKRPLY